MDDDTRVAHRLGALIAERHGEIVERWMGRAVAALPPGLAQKVPGPYLTNQVPVFLERLAGFLKGFPGPADASSELFHGEEYEHVITRSMAGYRVQDVVLELNLLRAELYLLFERAGELLTPRIGGLVNMFLDDIIYAVCGEFGEVQLASERRATEAARRISVLDRIATATRKATKVEAVFDAVLREIKEVLEVDAVTFLLPVPGKDALIARASVGLTSDVKAKIEVPFGAGFAGRVYATGQPMHIVDARYADIVSPFIREAVTSLLGVPLRYEERVLGVLHVASRSARQFTGDEERFLQLLSDRIAVAVAHASMIEAEQAARARADMERNRMRMLYETSGDLISVDDFRAVLRKVAERSLEMLGDWCLIDLLEGRALHSVAGAHRDPARRVWLTVVQRYTLYGGRRYGVIHSQTPVVGRDLTPENLREIASDEDHYQALVNLGTHSYIIVPLVARGEAFGTLSFGRAQGNYSDDDLALAAEIGRQTGLALDNALLVENLRGALRGREEILAVVSHDLRNPLSTILLSAEAAQRVRDPAKAERIFRHLGLIQRAGERMERLIGDLLDFSKISEQKLAIDRHPETAADILHEAVQLSKGVAASGNVRLIEDTRALDGELVDADRGRVLQVLANLITNAVRFSPPGTEVTIEARPAEGGVVFAVRDQGPGVAPEEAAHLFEPFWQGKQAKREGAGLGLAIAKGIVEAHGGRIWVDAAAAGGGAVFAFSLQAPQAH